MDELSLRVSLDRWQQAQEWEGAYWRAQHPTPVDKPGSPWRRLLRTIWQHSSPETNAATPATYGDDWNRWWADQFQQYEQLPHTFDNVIELGSGPYTNIRVILEGRSASHIFCSDPLVKDYVRFTGQWLAEMWRAGRVCIDDHPLEECPFASNYFDLVVLINVLDHCRDSLACIRQAMRITKPGGYLVLGQDLTDLDDVKRIGDDVGHPIRIDHHTLDRELLPFCEPVHRRILGREEGRNPSAHYGTYVLLGRKRDA
jgi:SAM-dependent methyltransferase